MLGPKLRSLEEDSRAYERFDVLAKNKDRRD